MDELVKQVAAKAGISEDQARSAVTHVVDFIKGRLPEPIAAHVDSVVNGASGGVGGDIAGKVGDLLGF
jgi:hypothetical protein